jgi:hypothetical protein
MISIRNAVRANSTEHSANAWTNADYSSHARPSSSAAHGAIRSATKYRRELSPMGLGSGIFPPVFLAASMGICDKAPPAKTTDERVVPTVEFKMSVRKRTDHLTPIGADASGPREV